MVKFLLPSPMSAKSCRLNGSHFGLPGSSFKNFLITCCHLLQWCILDRLWKANFHTYSAAPSSHLCRKSLTVMQFYWETFVRCQPCRRSLRVTVVVQLHGSWQNYCRHTCKTFLLKPLCSVLHLIFFLLWMKIINKSAWLACSIWYCW